MTMVNLTRDGDCACGAPVSLHFDRNRRLSCDVATRRFRQHQLEQADAPAQEPLRHAHVQAGPRQSIFALRGGVFHE